VSANDQDKKDLIALRERLQDLKIVISEHDGVFTANTYSEPLFCFERPTLEAVQAVVEDTLTSYVKNFYHVDNVRISTAALPVESPVVPIQRVEPTSRLKPSFDKELVSA
jgi:hypothetical protein